MMGTEIFKIDASWAEKLTKTRVSFLMTPTVVRPIKAQEGPARSVKLTQKSEGPRRTQIGSVS